MSAKKADRWQTLWAERRIGNYMLEVERTGLLWRYTVRRVKGARRLLGYVASGYAAKEWQAKLYARRAMEKHARGGR